MATEADRIRLRHMLDAAREAAGRVSPEARQLLPDLRWPDIVGMRNRLIHACFNVDLTVLHTTIVDGLPVLVVALTEIMESESMGEAEGRNDRYGGA